MDNSWCQFGVSRQNLVAKVCKRIRHSRNQPNAYPEIQELNRNSKYTGQQITRDITG